MSTTTPTPMSPPAHAATRPSPRTRRWATHWRGLLRGEDGMSTAEYAVGTIAAAAFAAVLYAVVTGDSVVSGLTSLVQRALAVRF